MRLCHSPKRKKPLHKAFQVCWRSPSNLRFVIPCAPCSQGLSRKPLTAQETAPVLRFELFKFQGHTRKPFSMDCRRPLGGCVKIWCGKMTALHWLWKPLVDLAIALQSFIWSDLGISNCVIWNYRTLNLVFKQLKKHHEMVAWKLRCSQPGRRSKLALFLMGNSLHGDGIGYLKAKWKLKASQVTVTLQLEMTVFSLLLMFGFHFDFDRHEFESLVCACRRFKVCLDESFNHGLNSRGVQVESHRGLRFDCGLKRRLNLLKPELDGVVRKITSDLQHCTAFSSHTHFGWLAHLLNLTYLIWLVFGTFGYIWIIFPYIDNHPTDELIFFRGVAQPPTSNFQVLSHRITVPMLTVAWPVVCDSSCISSHKCTAQRGTPEEQPEMDESWWIQGRRQGFEST